MDSTCGMLRFQPERIYSPLQKANGCGRVGPSAGRFGLIFFEDLLDALMAWLKVESEMSNNTPCPDLALRAFYRKKASELTDAAIKKAKKE